jgi:AraC-like DNA-binding protein
MFVQREPSPALRPFVATMWAQRAPTPRPARERDLSERRALEYVLPTGAVHVVFRLGSSPLRVLDARGHETRFVGAVVGGPRASAYLKDVSDSQPDGGDIVGVQLRVGAAALIFPGPLHALADAHTPLDALWGPEAVRLRAQLTEEPSLARRLDRLEAALLARARHTTLRPELAPSVALLARGRSLADACRAAGLSERRFREVFTDAVGLAPKTFARVARLGRALGALVEPTPSLATIALEAGFADQAHLHREMKAITGLTPAMYRSRRPRHPHHVRA